MRKIIGIVTLIFLLVIFAKVTIADDFGEGDRNVGQLLDNSENVSDENGQDLDEESPSFVEQDEQEEQIGGDQNLFFLTLQLFAALGAVLFIIYVLLKFINKRAQNFNSHSTIQTIGGVGVGSNRSVQLVKIGDRLLVVGVGETVQLLKEIDNPEELEQIMKNYQQSQEFFDEPISRVSGWLKSRKSQSTMNTDSNGDAFRSLLNREMEEVKDSQKKVHSALEEKDR